MARGRSALRAEFPPALIEGAELDRWFDDHYLPALEVEIEQALREQGFTR